MIQLCSPPASWRAALKLFGALGEYDVVVLGNTRFDAYAALASQLAGSGATVMEIPRVDVIPDVVADVFVTPSQWLLEHESLQSPRARQVRVIHPGVDVETFRPCEEETDVLPGHARAVRVGLVGRVDSEKGPGIFLQICAALRAKWDLDVVVIGSGPMEQSVWRKAERLGLAVNFTGHVSHDRLPAYLRELDIVVLPGSIETFGIVAVEVLATGKQLVSFGAGGTADFLRNGYNAWIAKNTTVESLTDALDHAIEMLAVPDIVREISHNARETAKCFTWNRTVTNYLKLFHSLVNQQL